MRFTAVVAHARLAADLATESREREGGRGGGGGRPNSSPSRDYQDDDRLAAELVLGFRLLERNLVGRRGDGVPERDVAVEFARPPAV